MRLVALLFTLASIGGFLASPASAEKLVLQMLGESIFEGDLAAVNATEGTHLKFGKLGVNPTDFACFRMPLIDPNTKLSLGTGVDCLRFDNTDNFPVQIGVTAISFFSTPTGTLVNMGATSLGQFLAGFGQGNVLGDGTGVQVTHMTGSVPGANPDTIVGGTGVFDNAKGFARVSGAVNAVTPTPNFNCLWVVTLD